MREVRKARIIIFDDDDFILRVLDHFFAGMDLEVLTFAEPVPCRHSESDETCRIPCADMLITDFRMPLRNGIELLRDQTQCGCTIGIENKAVLSGELPSECMEETYQVAGRFFAKPIPLDELNAWAEECIGRIDLTRPLSSYDGTGD